MATIQASAGERACKGKATTVSSGRLRVALAVFAAVALIVALEVMKAIEGPNEPPRVAPGHDPYRFMSSPGVSPRS